MSFTVEKDVMVAMRDGVELATDAWIPSVTPAPTLLVRLPYGKDLPQLLAYGLVPNYSPSSKRVTRWCTRTAGARGDPAGSSCRC